MSFSFAMGAVLTSSPFFSSSFLLSLRLSLGTTTELNNCLGMFQQTNAFNQDISKWQVAKVTDFTFMFGHAYAFNQDLSTWKLDGVFDKSGIGYSE